MKTIFSSVTLFIGLTGLIFSINSCSKDEARIAYLLNPANQVVFHHAIGDDALVLDSMIYINAAGEHYEITDLQYFISRITLYTSDGKTCLIRDDQGIHYSDARIPSTLLWDIATEIPEGIYDSVAFTFGLDEQDNISNRFPDPPERDMFWPEILGGGYHHMKLNTKWRNDTMNEALPFMMHLGTGQIYAGEQHDPDSIIGYIPNAFRVVCVFPSFEVSKETGVQLSVTMHIDRWYNGPPVQFSLADLPQGIMQDQDAMQRVCMNGRRLFSVQMIRSGRK